MRLTIRRICLTVLALLPVLYAPALGDPALRVEVRPEGVRLELDGSFAGSTYTVWRSDSRGGSYRPITSQNLLCMGECVAWDPEAIPGRTEYYRFDLVPPGGGLVSYGPYAVAIPRPPLAVRLTPNPARAATRIDVTVPGDPIGAPATATVRIVDAQGRAIRMLHHGAVPRGGLALTWDGRDENGRPTGPGIYLVLVASGRGSTTGRLIRVQ